MKVLAIAIGILVATPIAAAAREACGIYPQDVHKLDTMAGAADCGLKDLGEKPLWRGPDANIRQRIRFTFVDGHFRYFRVIDFVEVASGKASVSIQSVPTGPGDQGKPHSRRRTFAVSPEEVARLNELGEQSGVWAFPFGTWDDPDPSELWFHCETLDMERANADGYRFSTVSISCNQPRKLMPFVSYLTGLANLRDSDGLF